MTFCADLEQVVEATSTRLHAMSDETCVLTFPVSGPDGHDVAFYARAGHEGRWKLSDRGDLAFELSVFGIRPADLQARLASVTTAMPLIAVTERGEFTVDLPAEAAQAGSVLRAALAAYLDGWALEHTAQAPSVELSLVDVLEAQALRLYPEISSVRNTERTGASGIPRSFHIQFGVAGRVLGRAYSVDSAGALKDRAELLGVSADDVRRAWTGRPLSFFYCWDDDVRSPSTAVLKELRDRWAVVPFPKSEREGQLEELLVDVA